MPFGMSPLLFKCTERITGTVPPPVQKALPGKSPDQSELLVNFLIRSVLKGRSQVIPEFSN